jgi:heptosyltransferase-1
MHPAIDQVIPVASRRWRRSPLNPATWIEIARFRRGLRVQEFETIVDTQGLIRSAVIAWMARGRRHGYDAESVRERAATNLYDVRHAVPRDLHAIMRNRTLTGLALGYAPGGTPDFGLDRERLRARSDNRYAVLLHATARPDKEWPTGHWISLAQALRARQLRLVLPWGNQTERNRSNEIAAAVKDAAVPDLQPLDAVARMIAGASLVIGVDTGLTHLAAALSVPLAAIFVGSEPVLTGPIGHGPIRIVGRNGGTPALADVLEVVEPLL